MKSLYIAKKRGDVIETRHKVHAVAFQGEKALLQCGNDQLVTPMRSAAKPFMICQQIETCKHCGIYLSDAQISVMISSHNGETMHREEVNRLLEMSGSSAEDLHCGTHLPYFDWLYKDFFAEKNLSKRQLFHNCSGKHAGMLLLSTLTENDKTGYWDTRNPVQQMIIASAVDVMNISKSDSFSLVLDGCGVPTYCVTLKKIAEAYRQLYKNEYLKPIIIAAQNEPHMIAGTGRIETDIIRCSGFFAKSGSEGIFCVAVPEEDIYIALKVEDGDDDAAESAIVEILIALDLLTEEQVEMLNGYRYLEIYTSTGVLTGHLFPEWEYV